ncbi:MAG: hypothetical protein K0V04_23220 [Deltaproteobacteria bacterium]|nr:hypothetical protein [Deltaproteobacteria bacterium]
MTTTLRSLAGDSIVVEHAPQLELLERAPLAVAHGSMNTTTECLQWRACNTGSRCSRLRSPTISQGVTTRVAWSAAEMLTLRRLTVARLRGATERVLGEPSSRANASRLQAACRSQGAVDRAAFHHRDRAA